VATHLKFDSEKFDFTDLDETGPFINVRMISGAMSGRFGVARIIARVFPAQREFTESIIKEGVESASDFPFGPYPNDKLTYHGDSIVEFQTPPHSEGLGTEYGLRASDEPINGVAILSPDEGDGPSISLLTVRLTPDKAYLTPQIIQQFERDEREHGN
jgi:hypothetical protein